MGVKRISIVTRRTYKAADELYSNFEVADEGELCVAIGGDGTFLEAARKHNCPILLIRGGESNSLGFHADAALCQLSDIIKKLKLGEFTVEDYPKLRIAFKGNIFEAVNEVALFRETPSAIHCKMGYYDEKGRIIPLYPRDIRGDGVIISRQIGSTAYNFYAHGPVIFGIDVAVVTPISANYKFSIVCDRCFQIELKKSTGCLEYDGLFGGRLEKGDIFTVARSDKVVRVVRMGALESFSEKLSRLLAF